MHHHKALWVWTFYLSSSPIAWPFGHHQNVPLQNAPSKQIFFRSCRGFSKFREERSMDQYRSRPKLSENFEHHWSIPISGGNSYGPIIGPYLFLGNSYGPMVLKVLQKVSPYTGNGPWMALPRNWSFESPGVDCVSACARCQSNPSCTNCALTAATKTPKLFVANGLGSWIQSELFWRILGTFSHKNLVICKTGWCKTGWCKTGMSEQGYGSYMVHACTLRLCALLPWYVGWIYIAVNDSHGYSMSLVCSWNELGMSYVQVSSSPFCMRPFWRIPKNEEKKFGRTVREKSAAQNKKSAKNPACQKPILTSLLESPRLHRVFRAWHGRRWGYPSTFGLGDPHLRNDFNSQTEPHPMVADRGSLYSLSFIPLHQKWLRNSEYILYMSEMRSERFFLWTRLDLQSTTQSIINSTTLILCNALRAHCSSTFVKSNYPCCSRNVCDFHILHFYSPTCCAFLGLLAFLLPKMLDFQGLVCISTPNMLDFVVFSLPNAGSFKDF